MSGHNSTTENRVPVFNDLDTINVVHNPVGAKYQRLDRTITETAQVLAVETNDVGISHVLYIGRFEAKNGHGAEYVDQRKLALSTFQSAFTEVS